MATKKTTKKAPAKKPSTKSKTTTKKVPLSKPVKKTAKKTVTKKPVAKKKAVQTKAKVQAKAKAKVKVKAKAKAPAPKKVATKTTKKVVKKAVKKVVKKIAKKAVLKKAKRLAKEDSLNEIIEKEKIGKATSRPKAKSPASVVFSLEDVEALVAKQKDDAPKEAPKTKVNKVVKKKLVSIKNKPAKKQSHAPASISDILGFNPAKKANPRTLADKEIPAKWKKYYKLLIELRKHVKEELELHTSQTLKQSSKDNAGDLSGYGSHQADAGTDSFDRDFALGILSSEQDALNEIEESIIRIKDGTYGICQETGKPINKERLTAVPFARYSLEGQKEFEKNNRKRRDRGVPGLFDDSSDSPNIANSSDDE